MKVKVGDTVYDGAEEKVMVILTDGDKKNIAEMPADNTQYCCAPQGTPEEEIEKWMAEV